MLNFFKKKKLKEQHIVVFSGAGISAPSGLSTFRGNNGLWNNHRIEDVCNEYTWKQNFDLVHDFYNERRMELKNVKPNNAHKYFANLQKENPDQVTLITQNVDNLFERAGAELVYHLHGFLTEMKCLACGNIWDIKYGKWDQEENRCECGSRKGVKPNIVFFGGDAPQYKILHDFINVSNFDNVMFIVIGTDGSVIPIDELLRQKGCIKILCNKYESDHIFENVFDYYYEKSIIEALPEIENLINTFLKGKLKK